MRVQPDEFVVHARRRRARGQAVVDQDRAISFVREEAVFSNGRRATVFRSETPIPMRHRPAQRFQMWAGERLLYRRLPNASLERMGTHAGGDMLVSEIYINQ